MCVQEVSDSPDRTFLDLRTPGAQPIGDLNHRGSASLPTTGAPFPTRSARMLLKCAAAVTHCMTANATRAAAAQC
jgi:hypothetical protein